jgi:hypothetical protein
MNSVGRLSLPSKAADAPIIILLGNNFHSQGIAALISPIIDMEVTS